MFKTLKIFSVILVLAVLIVGSFSWAQFTGPSFTTTGATPWLDLGGYIYYEAGNVGVGEGFSTLAPDAKFHLRGSNDPGSTLILQRSENSPNSPQLFLRKSRNTVLAPTATLLNDSLGMVGFGGYDGGNWFASSYLFGQATENWTPTAKGSGLVFRTTPNGTSTGIDRMRIDQSGNLIVGPTNTLFVDVNFGRVGINTVPTSAALHVQGNVQIDSGQILQSNWVGVTFLNGWANYAGRTDASYLIDKQGFIHLKGEITGGTIADGTVIFQLPVGFRPNESFEHALVYDNGAGARTIGSLFIQSNGNCQIYSVSSNTRVSLGMIIFRQSM